MDRPLSRQPECSRGCQHEEHHFACDWCLCGAHEAPGIYPQEA